MELIEVKAPEGYDLAKKSVIEVKEITKVQEFTLSNELTPVVPDTGDHGNMWIWEIGLIVNIVVLGIGIFYKRKTRNI